MKIKKVSNLYDINMYKNAHLVPLCWNCEPAGVDFSTVEVKFGVSRGALKISCDVFQFHHSNFFTRDISARIVGGLVIAVFRFLYSKTPTEK